MPPEIWVMIIRLILDERRRPYHYFTPEINLRRHASQLYFGDDGTADEWKSIRSVSSLWNRLAGAPPHFHFRYGYPHIPKGVFVVFIDFKTRDMPTYRRLSASPELVSNVTTLVLTDSLSADGVEFLFGLSIHLSALNCLSIAASIDPQIFWAVIQTKFPNLAALTVRLKPPLPHTPVPQGLYDIILRGTVTLEKLEALDITTLESQALHLPSLKHLVIRGWSFVHAIDFLKVHGQQLESFLCVGSPLGWNMHRHSIWTILPNLKYFGDCPFYGTIGPPDHHPLRHLRLRMSTLFGRGIETVNAMLSIFPSITHVYFVVDGGDLFADDLLRVSRSRHLKAFIVDSMAQ